MPRSPIKRRIKVPATQSTVTSAGVGSIITFNLELGMRYHQIDIVFGDLTNAQTFTTVIGDIILLRNDQAQRTHSALELDQLNKVNGTQYAIQANGTSGTDREQTAVIYLSEPWRKDIAQADAMAWNVDPSWGFRTFQVKIYVAVALSATASIALWAEVDDLMPATNNGVQVLKKVYRTSLTASGANNEYTATNFPPNRGAYQAVYFKQPSTSGVIKYVTAKNGGISGVILKEKISNYENWSFLTGRGMNPGTSVAASGFGFDIVFDWLDPLQDAIPFGQNGVWFRLDYVTTAVGNVDALSEVLGSLD